MFLKKICLVMLLMIWASCSNSSDNEADNNTVKAINPSNLDSLITQKFDLPTIIKPGSLINQTVIFKDTSYQTAFKIKDLVKPSWLSYDSVSHIFSSKTLSVAETGNFSLLFNWQSKEKFGSIVKHFSVTKWNSSIIWQAKVGNTKFELMTASNSKTYAQSLILNTGSLIVPNDSLPSAASETKYFAFFAELPAELKNLGDSLKLEIEEFRSYSNARSRFGLKSANNTSYSIEVYTFVNTVGGNMYYFYPTYFVSNLNSVFTSTTINNYSNIGLGTQTYILKTSPNYSNKVSVSSYVDGTKTGTINNINLVTNEDKFSSIFCEFMAGLSNAQNRHYYDNMQLNKVKLTLNGTIVYSTEFND